MRNIIKDLTKNTSNPPNVLDSVCCSDQDINHLIGSLLAMLSSIMRNEVTDKSINVVEREIKIFLTYLHLVQNNIDINQTKKKTKPY